jgi:hypothetical protein
MTISLCLARFALSGQRVAPISAERRRVELGHHHNAREARPVPPAAGERMRG